MISRDCSPVEKMLNCAIGIDSGPGGRPSSPSGNQGRADIADGAQREGGAAGQGGRIAEEVARRRDIAGDARRRVGEQIGRGERAREEDGGARLLRHRVDRVDQRVGAAHQAQYLAIGVDDDDRVLGAVVERPAQLGAGLPLHQERLLEQGAHFGRAQRPRAVGAGLDRIALGAGAVAERPRPRAR